jgi:hypothetical protein
MADNGESSPLHRRGQSENAIPLRILNPNGLNENTDAARGVSHARTLSERGRALFRSSRQSVVHREQDGRYAPIGETSPSPPLRQGQEHGPVSPRMFVSSPDGQRARIPDEDDEAAFSPIADRGAFQSAVGFAGLSFTAAQQSPQHGDDEIGDTPPTPSTRSSRATRDSLPRLSTSRTIEDGVRVSLDDGPTFFSPGVVDEDDTLPLTDSSHLNPSTLAPPLSPDEQRHQRNRRPSSNLSVRFSSSLNSIRPSRTSRSHSDRSARLGDDLPNLEAGSSQKSSRLSGSPSGRNRSLSALSGESSLRRTGTILQQMSQRVVNLSHEPEVERDMRRKSSVKTTPEGGVPPIPTIRTDEHFSTYDGSGTSGSPGNERTPSPVSERPEKSELPRSDPNPLRGRSLGIFSKDSRVRTSLLEILVNPWTEPLILLLIIVQAVILAVDAAKNVYNDPRPKGWGNAWTDYALVAIFTVYTIETILKIIVSGFILNPHEYSTIDRRVGLGKALAKRANDMFALHRRPSTIHSKADLSQEEAPPSLLRSFTSQGLQDSNETPGSSRQAQKRRLAHRAYLRHSFNRLDFVAVVSFWISFALGAAGIEWGHQLYVFRMMSCLRILRLLNITSGTSVILRSLKRAAPTLLNVAFLISFFWLLFAIVGVQSFKSSLKRQCNWDGTPFNQSNWTNTQVGTSGQYCGGWTAANNSQMPWLTADGGWGNNAPKGFICPVGSFCMEGENPWNNTVSFDNIANSLEMVFVIMTSNTFTDIMYDLTDSDYLAAAIFTAMGTMIMSLWLINLLIAVITSSFQVIREESKSSAFVANKADPAEDPGHTDLSGKKRKTSGLQKLYEKTRIFWIVVIVFGLVVQSLRNSTMHKSTETFINAVELVVTLVLDVEIIFRFICDWRGFRHHRRNWVDLGLAVITTVIQIPSIHNSGTPYAWLTFFQILRIYRVVLVIKITRDLITLVLRHVSGVLNLILFVFLLTFLAAIFATQLFRGTLPQVDQYGNNIQVTFATIYNGFLGMYQILSSENWTTILYDVTSSGVTWDTAWIGAAFFILWYILANFIVLNMFIAVIQENFDVSEDQKRMQQVRMFLQQKEMASSSSHGTLSLSKIFNFGRAKRQDPLDFGSAATDMLTKEAVVKDFLDDIEVPDSDENEPVPNKMARYSTTNLGTTAPGFWTGVYARTLGKLFKGEPNPFYARLQLKQPFEELDPKTLAREVAEATELRKVTQRDYLRQHPTYNNSLYMFAPENPIRRFCQRIVGPGRGSKRVQGVQPNPTAWYISSVIIYMAIVAMVLLACITTPLYQREYFDTHEFKVKNWFVFTDIGFAALFLIEAIIKVIADGFFFTPNAYFRSSWGFIDGLVLITLWANVFTSLYDPGSGSRAVGAFKALRALRLLNVSDSARDTFHSVIVLGGWKVISAAFVSLSLLIPFAIYGVNLFAGQMISCNDETSNIYNLTDCVNEYVASPFNWNILAPRAPANSYYDFDSFGGSLFILFQVVSQEGWIDVMNRAEAITGIFTQTSELTTQGNAVFFVVFNLLGAVFVLTLFVSVFMRNYTEQTGVAFLTTDQRSWLELRKMLRQLSPTKGNNDQKRPGWKEWCYRRAVNKNGRWHRGLTIVLVAHLVLLCLEFYPEPLWWSLTRYVVFLLFTLLYVTNIGIRIVGKTWARFRKSAWDVYSLFAILGTVVSTVLLFSDLENRTFAQVHKLLLVSVVLLLIPRNDQLDQLFKTAAASLTSITNLLATWFVLFLVFAIALTQTFGLTRFGSQETGNVNVRTVPKALILLFRCSMGEGWNQIMEDYATVVTPYCTVGQRYFDGDCGSEEWARAIFISWNILSMYIFVNLFISLIYESFSYVYQRSSGLSIISREETRRFKLAWSEYDPDGTGYLSKEKFPRFLGELSGVFEMRIYDGDFTVKELIDSCRKAQPRRTSSLPVDGASLHESKEIDLRLLNEKLNEMPIEQIRRRRARMNLFYEEVLVSSDPDRGISFNTLLMIIAHYKVINDNKSLRLEEFLRRRARLQRVEESLNRQVVVGFFDTLYWRRQFRRQMNGKQAARMTGVPSFEVPEIFIQDEDDDVSQVKKLNVPSVSITPVDFDDSNTSTRPGKGRNLSISGSDAGSTTSTLEQQQHMRHRSNSIQTTPSHSPTRGSAASSPHPSPRLMPSHRPTTSQGSIQPDWHFAAALESAGTGVTPPGSPLMPDTALGSRSRANSAVSQHDMMDSFGSSAWGESIRRTATTKRASTVRRPSASGS